MPVRKVKKEVESSDPLILLLQEIAKEKGLTMEILIPIVEEAIAKAYKNTNPNFNVEVVFNPERDAFEISQLLVVTEDDDWYDEDTQLNILEAKDIDPELKAGDIYRRDIPIQSLGRIAAQNMKQIMNAKILEAEKNILVEEYKDKIDLLIYGTVTRVHRNMVYVNIGRAEALMVRQEQNPMEHYAPGKGFNFVITEIKLGNKGPQIYVSRNSANLVRRIFEREVPEISSGEVEIMAVAREAGSRTKVSVRSKNPDIDPVGACVGPRRIRMENIVDELSGEKIDVIEWSDNPAILISNALSPARVMRVEVYWDATSALVVVPNDQLSLAIGREGQNARLAVRLTGWKIDIKDENQYNEYLLNAPEEGYDDDEFEDEYEEDEYEDDEEFRDENESREDE